jgi:ATPase subunit of ABC transporter with duplicated ATPase domains
MAEAPKIIYSMLGVSKTIEKRTIIKDISLSYFYGAKIGVLGLNGAGKSTVLKIMAGVDTEWVPRARATARRDPDRAGGGRRGLGGNR